MSLKALQIPVHQNHAPKRLKSLATSLTKELLEMHIRHLFPTLLALFLQGTSVPGQGLLNGIVAFITGPFGKGITLIALVICGCGYMFGNKSDNTTIARCAIGAALIVGAANIFAYIQAAG
jgi:type IV secretory pathway VirB2 component (pilin)